MIGNKMTSLLKLTKQNTMFWLLYTNLQNKTHYRRTVPLCKIAKKSAEVYCFKNFVWVGNFPQ